MRPCRYLSTGFEPKRRLIFVHASFMAPPFVSGPAPSPWRFHALTAKRLAAKAYTRYAEWGYRSVALREGDRWHAFGPEWHSGDCPHTSFTAEGREAAHIDGQVEPHANSG